MVVGETLSVSDGLIFKSLPATSQVCFSVLSYPFCTLFTQGGEDLYGGYFSEYPFEKAHATDAAFDLTAKETHAVRRGRTTVVSTGLYLALPEGWAALVCSRSGLATRGIFVVNAPGVIDSGYRGEVKVILGSLADEPVLIMKGDRIAQLLFMQTSTPPIHRHETHGAWEQKWGKTDRGVNGLGSTGLRVIQGGRNE
jgi:dUTP pyrophosphatase